MNAQPAEPPCTDPYARWCGRVGGREAPPYPDGYSEERVQAIIATARGNAFFLEELIRHEAEGAKGELPETIVAMVQSRLEGLEAEARLALRAGSLFGLTFWEGGVRALVGEILDPSDLGPLLEDLARQDLLELEHQSRFPGHREFSFRSGLVREAVYATLTVEDRELGHRLAADWLEDAGELDARVMAEHLILGGLPERALPYVIRAARAHLSGRDFDGALEMVALGDRLGAEGKRLGELRGIEAQARVWSNEDLARGSRAAKEALELLPPGSAEWLTALATSSHAGAFGGHLDALASALAHLQAFKRQIEPIGPAGVAGAALCNALVHAGMAREARDLLHILEGAERGEDLIYTAWLEVIRAVVALYEARPATAQLAAHRAVELFHTASEHAATSVVHMLLGAITLDLGAFDETSLVCRRAIEAAREMGSQFLENASSVFLALARAYGGDIDGALGLTNAIIGEDPLISAVAREYEALALASVERWDAAHDAAKVAIRLGGPMPLVHVGAYAVLAEAQLRAERFEDARESCRLARDRQALSGCFALVDASISAAEIGLLLARGERVEAANAARAARRRAAAAAEGLDDEARRAMLDGVPPQRLLRRRIAAALDAE